MKARIVISLALMLLLTQPAMAVSNQAVLTEGTIEKIKNNCGTILANLKRVEENDTAARIIRGRTYQGEIADKLMVPLNQRIVRSKLDGSMLLSLTADYSASVAKFSDAYTRYETRLEQTMDINCQASPVQFYDSLVETREQRAEVAEAVQRTDNLLRTYHKQVGLFTKKEVAP